MIFAENSTILNNNNNNKESSYMAQNLRRTQSAYHENEKK